MYRKAIFSLIAIVTAFLAAQGCGTSDAPDDPPAARTQTALSTEGPEPNEEHFCGAELVAWNLGRSGGPYDTCSGGVEYAQFNMRCPHPNTESCEVCGSYQIETCGVPRAKICAFADYLGTIHQRQKRPGDWGEEVCEYCGPGRVCCEREYIPTLTCNEVMQGTVDRFRGGDYNGQHNGGQAFNWGGATTGGNLVEDGGYFCDYDLFNAPINFHTAESEANCGTNCWMSTKCNSCTVFKDDRSCGTTINHLDVGKSLKDVPGINAPEANNFIDKTGTKTLCMTDENNPINEATRTSDVREKFTRLVRFYNRAEANQIPGVDNLAVRRQIAKQIQRLFEIAGAELEEANQQLAINVSLANFPANLPGGDPLPSSEPGTCGVVFTPPDLSRCPAQYKDEAEEFLNRGMSFCARLASSHVDPRVRALEVVEKTCVDLLATDIAKLRRSLAGNTTDDGSPYAVLEPADGGVGTIDPNDVCGFKTYRQQYDSFVTRGIQARLAEPKDPSNEADVPELRARLKLVDRWYNAIGKKLYPYVSSEPLAGSVRAEAWRHATDMEGALWSGVYRRMFPQGPVTASDGGALDSGAPPPPPTFDADKLAALVKDTLKADRAMLKLLFPADPNTAPPLDNVPLLLVMGDAFEGMMQRMRDVGIYHDMGCTYIGCGPAVRSELAWLMTLLPEISDNGRLQTLVNAARIPRNSSGEALVDPEWLDVYGAISGRHVALQNAMRDLMSGGAGWTYEAHGKPLLELGAGDLPKPLQHLAGLMQATQAATQSYETTGLFSRTARNQLPAGMANETVDGIRNLLQERAGELEESVGKFNMNLNTMANAVIQEMTAKGAMTSSADRIKKKGLEYDYAMADMGGLRASLEANIDSFGTFAKAYSELTVFDPNAELDLTTHLTVQIDAKSARASGPVAPNSDIRLIATQKALGLPKGSIATVQVGPSDKWTPTCALQRQNAVSGGLRSPVAPGSQPIDMADSLTGPEGYIVTMANGTARLKANETAKNNSRTTQSGFEAKLCQGVNVSGGLDLIGNKSTVYVDASFCSSYGQTETSSKSQVESNTVSQDSRSSVNFASGLRLATTPFPKAPVGALLAVVTDKDKPSQWRDVRVVYAPATAIILEADSDVYLVTNDIAASDCVVNDMNKLTVKVQTTMHTGDAVKWVPNALSVVGTYLDALSNGDSNTGIVSPTGGSILAQGRLTPNQIATIRSTANVKLVEACKADPTVPPPKTICDVSQLPPTVQEFITNYFDREIEKLDLKIEIMQSARALNGIALDIQTMVNDYNASLQQSKVGELIPQWTLRNLDHQLLQRETAQLVNATTYQLYPILQLRYPKVFVEGLQDIRDEMQALVNAKWDAPINVLARDAAAAARALHQKTAGLATTYPTVNPTLAMLAFSRPTVDPTTQWYSAAKGRGDLVWKQALNGSHVVTFRILPEDLYRAAGGPPSLVCTQEVPVVRDLAVILAGGGLEMTDERSVNQREIKVSSFSAAKMQFPRGALLNQGAMYWPSGLLDFDLSNLDWASMHTQVLASVAVDQAKTIYNGRQHPPGTDPNRYFSNGRGLSPFTEFTVDLSSFYNPAIFPNGSPVNRAHHMIVALTLEYRHVGVDRALSFIRTCN